MDDEIHLELRQDALEQVVVGDGAGELAVHAPGERGLERRDVDGDDRAPRVGEAGDQAVADLAPGAGDERDRRAHYELSPSRRPPRPPRIEPSPFRRPPADGAAL